MRYFVCIDRNFLRRESEKRRTGMKPENAIEGAELQNMLQGLQMMQPAMGTPGAGVIDGFKQSFGIEDPKQEIAAPKIRAAFDMNL